MNPIRQTATRVCVRPEAVLQLSNALATATPHQVIEAAVEQLGVDRVALVSSFGTESAALLKVAADVDPAIPVIFLDTGWLFDETLAYRDALIERLHLTDVRSIKPDPVILAEQDADRDLWFSDPDACCHIRKVLPLQNCVEVICGLDQRSQTFSRAGANRASGGRTGW